MSVAARIVDVRKVVKPRVQAEVVKKREEGRAGVKERVGGKIIEIDAVVGVIGVEEILKAQVNVVDEILVSEVAVVTKGRAVGKLEIVPAAAQRGLAVEESRMCRCYCCRRRRGW